VTAPQASPAAVLSVRPAEPGDTEALLRLVRQLAEHVGSPEAVEMTASMLSDALFGPGAFVRALVATDGGRVVGSAVYYPTFSTWQGRTGLFLEDLVVERAWRRRGVGGRLLAALAAVCLAEGHTRLDWEVLASNTSARAFYDAIGAQAHPEEQLRRVTGDALAALAAGAAG
jgi:GNAT superfamily N-acetyltransferase